MSYATLDDLRARMGAELLTLLADDDGDLAADEPILSAALDDASARIDAALGGRYPAPFDPPHPLLRRVCIDLAGEGLFLRTRAAAPADFIHRADDARELLAEIARGAAPLPGVSACEAAMCESTTRGEPRHFDHEGLDAF